MYTINLNVQIVIKIDNSSLFMLLPIALKWRLYRCDLLIFIFKMKRSSLPFVISSRPESNSVRCCGCKSSVNSDSLRLGVREYKTTSWFHYQCFWTKCIYKNHLRGVQGNILLELVDGLHQIGPCDRNKLIVNASAASAESQKKKPETVFEGSEADGDYELDDNTFDLGNLVCVAVIKIQSNVLVSIRKYFIPRGRHVAKPTKFGISLTADQWLKLESQAEDISAAITTTQKALKDKDKERPGKCTKTKSEANNPGNMFSCRTRIV